jgi:hypothetical protein
MVFPISIWLTALHFMSTVAVENLLGELKILLRFGLIPNANS